MGRFTVKEELQGITLKNKIINAEERKLLEGIRAMECVILNGDAME